MEHVDRRRGDTREVLEGRLQPLSLFASHQDPDIISSLALWLEVNPQLRCYLGSLWASFVPHFGGDDTTFISLPDEGAGTRLRDISSSTIRRNDTVQR